MLTADLSDIGAATCHFVKRFQQVIYLEHPVFVRELSHKINSNLMPRTITNEVWLKVLELLVYMLTCCIRLDLGVNVSAYYSNNYYNTPVVFNVF